MLELLDYIVRAGLDKPTLPERVEALLRDNGHPRTCAHVFAVAEAAGALAERFQVEAAPCRQAALLHDVSAVVRPADMLRLMEARGAWLDEAERLHPFLLHQRVSRVVAAEDFGVTDPRVLSAAECHTTLKGDWSPVDLVVFLADKIAWDQPGEPPYLEALRAGLDSSLEEAALAYIDFSMENGRILRPHRWLLEARAALRSQTKGGER